MDAWRVKHLKRRFGALLSGGVAHFTVRTHCHESCGLSLVSSALVRAIRALTATRTRQDNHAMNDVMTNEASPQPHPRLRSGMRRMPSPGGCAVSPPIHSCRRAPSFGGQGNPRSRHQAPVGSDAERRERAARAGRRCLRARHARPVSSPQASCENVRCQVTFRAFKDSRWGCPLALAALHAIIPATTMSIPGSSR